MKNRGLNLLVAVLGLSLGCTPLAYADIDAIVQESAVVTVEPALSVQPMIVRYHHGIRYDTYPTSHIIVSTSYDRPVVQNMVVLSNELGWDTFYVQTPNGVKGYSTQYVTEDDTTCGRKDCTARCGRKGCSPCAEKIYSPNCDSIDCSIPCDTECSTCCFMK